MLEQNLISISKSDYESLCFVRRHHPVSHLDWSTHYTPDPDSDYFEFAFDFTKEKKDIERDSLYFHITSYKEEELDHYLILKFDAKTGKSSWLVENETDFKTTALEKHKKKILISTHLSKALPKVLEDANHFMSAYKAAAATAESETLTTWLKEYNETTPVETWLQLEKKGEMRSMQCELSPWFIYESSPQLCLTLRLMNIKDEPYPLNLKIYICRYFNTHVVLILTNKDGAAEIFPIDEWAFICSIIQSMIGIGVNRAANKYFFASQPPLTIPAYLQLCEAIGENGHDFLSPQNPSPLKSVRSVSQFCGKINISWESDQLPEHWFIEEEDRKLDIYFYYNQKKEFVVDHCKIHTTDVFDFISATIQQMAWAFDIDSKDLAGPAPNAEKTIQIMNERAQQVDALFALICPKKFSVLSGSEKVHDLLDSSEALGSLTPVPANDFDFFWLHDGFYNLPVITWDKDTDIDHVVMTNELTDILTSWSIKFKPKQLTDIFSEDSTTFEGFKTSIHETCLKFQLVPLDVSSGDEFSIALVPLDKEKAVTKLMKKTKAPFKWVSF